MRAEAARPPAGGAGAGLGGALKSRLERGAKAGGTAAEGGVGAAHRPLPFPGAAKLLVLLRLLLLDLLRSRLRRPKRGRRDAGNLAERLLQLLFRVFGALEPLLEDAGRLGMRQGGRAVEVRASRVPSLRPGR